MLSSKRRSYKPYRYSRESDSWVNWRANQTSGFENFSAQKTGIPQEAQMKLGTYNILYGLRCNSKFLHYISADHQRYTEIVDAIIPEQDFDILFLNEVTDKSLGYILESRFVRENYFVNEIVWGGTEEDNWGREGSKSFGNMILSKYPFEWTFLGSKTRILAYFPVQGKSHEFLPFP